MASSKPQGSKSTDPSRREMVCNLLTQIFTYAERTKAAKASPRQEEDDAISLIELIQASYSVFERYGIGPPDDAVYHRYLLSLSINPERDWYKKILTLDLGTPPKVKRLCTGHRHSVETLDVVSKSTRTPRRQEMESKLNHVRQTSLTSLQKPVFNGKDQTQRDRFGDMLSLDSPIQRIHGKRSAFSAAISKNSPDNNEKLTAGRVFPLSDMNSEKMCKKEHVVSHGNYTKQKERIAAGERQLQMITTSIEQWRATQAVKQLVNQNKMQRFTTPLCIHALFHWVSLSLPEKINFHATESPRALPLCVLRRIAVDVKVLKKFAQKVWVWQMKTLMNNWHEEAQKSKSFRVRMIVKQRAAVLGTAFQCIQHWRLFTETEKCAADRSNWVTQRTSRSKLRSCLQHWRLQFQSRQRHHQADQYLTNRVFRGVLQSWQQVLESKRDERCRYEMARKRRMFCRWKREKERSQSSRALLCVFSNQRNLQVLHKSWNRLRKNVEQNHNTRMKSKLWQQVSTQRRRRQFLHRWQRAVERCKDFHEREERFDRFHRRRQLSQMFVRWASWTERQLAMEKMLSDATETRSAKLMSFFFTTWKSFTKETLLNDEKLVASVVRLRQQRVWEQWRKRTGTRSATRSLASAYSFHLLAKVFTCWKQFAARKYELRFAFEKCQQVHRTNVLSLHWEKLVANVHSQQQKQDSADTFKHKKLLKVKQNCLSGWYRHIHRMRACQLRGEQLKSSARRQNLMLSAWTSWRRAFWIQCAARLADDQLSTSRKSQTFRLWKQFVFKSKQRRERTMKVTEMLGSAHLHACFRQWEELIVTRDRLLRTSELIRQMICRRKWTTWKLALQTKRGQNKQLAEVTWRWQKRQLYARFHNWKATWRIRKRHRHLLHSTLLVCQQRVVETHFNAWKTKWCVTTANELAILEMQDKLVHFKLTRAIRYWNALRLDQDKRSRLLVKSLALWRQTLLKSAFQGLLANKQIRKQQQLKAQLARARYREHRIKLYFLTWSKWWRCKMKMTRKRDGTKLHLDRLKLERSVECLKLNCCLRKRLKAVHSCVVAMSSIHAKLAAFSRWKAFISQKYSDRNKIAARVVLMSIFRARKRLQRWKAHVQARKLMRKALKRAANASKSSQLQLHFKNWKLFMTQQVFSRALTKKAATFRYFCLLPLHFQAWKTFLVTRKRKEDLLLRARGLWCHQSQHRAFTAWTQLTVDKQQTKRAISKWKKQTICKTFASWKRFLSLEKRKKRNQNRAVNFFERRTCRKLLKTWQLTSRNDRLTRQCTQLWVRNASRRAFETWIHLVKLAQSSCKFLAKMRNETLVRVFTTWRESFRRKKQQLQDIQERFAVLWRMNTRSTSFVRWKRYVHLRRFIRRKFEWHRDVLLLYVLKEWRDVVTFRRRSRENAAVIADRRKHNVMKALWDNWRTKARVLRCVEALRSKVTENRVTFDLHQRLRAWKQFTVLSLTVKQFVRRGEMSLLRLTFIDGFQRYSELKHKERDLSKQIRCVHNAYLKKWLATKLQQRMSIISACENIRQVGSSKRLLSSAWAEWMNFHSRKQTQQAAVRQLRVQVSRLEDVDSALNRNKLSEMLRRWQTIQLARVFERWHAVTQSQQLFRLHTLKAIEWWHKTQCSRYFRGWMVFCLQQRKQRRIRAMKTKFKLKRTCKLWQLFKAASLSKKVVNENARHFHEMNIYRNSFETWRVTASSLRLKREQILKLYHSSRLRLLAALLGEWRKFAAMERTKHMQKTVARVVYQEKTMRRSFLEWKTNVAGICYHRHQLQINTERLQVLLLCSSFRAWHSWTQQHKKLQVILQVATTKCGAQTTSRVFTAWTSYAARNAGLRHKASSFVSFRRMQKGLTGLRSLVQQQKYLRTMQQEAQLFRSVLSSNQLSIICTRWRQLAALSRKKRAVTLRYLQNKLLPAAWSSWVELMKIKREQKSKTLTATLCWNNSFLRKAWDALVAAHNVKKEAQVRIAHADLHHRKCRLRKVLVHWCAETNLNQHFRAVCGELLTKWRVQTAYRCFCALHDHAGYCRKLRASESIITTKVRTASLLQAWYSWRKLILMVRFGKRRLLQRYWAAWIHSRESRKILESFQEQIQARVVHRTQRRCVEFWRQFVATRKIDKTMALMSSAFADTQLMKRLWLCWIKYVVQTRAAKSQLRNALAHMQLQLQFKAFRGWYAFVYRRQLLRLKVSQALATRTQVCSRMVFHTWKAFVVEARKNRKAQGFAFVKTFTHVMKHWKQFVVLCKVEQMIGASELRQIESSFLTWRQIVKTTHQVRAFRAESGKRQWLELVGIVFKSWKRRTQTHVHCRKMLTNVAIGNYLRFRFMLWQRFTIHRKRLTNLLLVVADPPACLSTVENLDHQTLHVENAATTGEIVNIESSKELENALQLPDSANDHQLVSLGQALAKKARVLQRFEVNWDLPEAWHRWRQIFHAQLFYRMRRLQFYFIFWQTFAHQQRRNRWVFIKLTNQRQAASAQTIFRAWAALVARVKQLQKDRVRERELWVLVTTEMARRERRQLKTTWHAWKFHVDEARHLRSSLDAYYRARLLTKFWLVWHHDFRRIMRQVRLERRRVETQMASFRVRRAVQNLRENQQRSKRARLVLEYFSNRRYDSLLPQVLSRWRQWCQREKEIAQGLESARKHKTQRHFLAWKHWKNTRKWQRVVVNNLQSKGVEKRRREVLKRWKRYTKTRIVKDLTLQKAAIFHVCWRLRNRWLRHAQRSIQLREREEFVHVKLCAFRGHRCVNRWRDYSRSRRLCRLYQRFVLRKHVQLWQSAVKYAVASRFDAFLMRSKAKKLLVAWQQVAAKHRYWRQLSVTLVVKKETQVARRVFLRWQQFVRVRQAKQLAVLHAEQSTLRRVWRCWSRVTRITQRLHHEQLEQAAEHEAISVLRWSLRVWQAAVKKQRGRRFVLLSCVVKLQSVADTRVQQVIFRSWKCLVQRERQCRRALVKRDCNAAKRALAFWFVWTRSRQQRQQQLQDAAKYHSQRLKSAVFFYWQTYALAWHDAAKPITRHLHCQQTVPVQRAAEACNTDKYQDSDDSEADVRRPTSPVMKRLQQKRANRTNPREDSNASAMVTLPDAVEVSMDVKKRLILLGKWKPQHK